MPQMRWTFQIFGERYNPHDPKREHNPYHILERAYAHKECDQQTANRILSEKRVDPELVASFEYYVKLYHIYFDWQTKGRVGSFYERCRMEGIEFKGIPAFYYEK